MPIDPFAVLGAPRRFDLDLSALEKTHRELSRALHPDKFARASTSERRMALDKAATVNEAWRIVRDPIRRAEALLTIGGIAVGQMRKPETSSAFLMDVLEQREALAQARKDKDMEKVRALGEDFEARKKAAEEKLTRGFALAFAGRESAPDRQALETVLPVLGELRFYVRLIHEVSAILEEEQVS